MTVRASLSPRYFLEPRIAVIWESLVKGFAISRSRASISRCREARSMSGSSVILFMPSTRSRRLRSTTKSIPSRLKPSIWADAPVSACLSSIMMFLPVRSGFWSEPESTNSRAMILCVSTNHV